MDLELIPYGCMATGPKIGFIEVVKNAKTIAEVTPSVCACMHTCMCLCVCVCVCVCVVCVCVVCVCVCGVCAYTYTYLECVFLFSSSPSLFQVSSVRDSSKLFEWIKSHQKKYTALDLLLWK